MKSSVPLSLLLIACAWRGPLPVSAGTLTGVVTARGPRTPENGGGDSYGSLRYKFAERIDYDRLRDFVVYIDQPVATAMPPASTPAVVVQRNVDFAPHVTPICVGGRVVWPNRDQIYHNVFSMSEVKPFDLGLRTDKDRPAEVLFDRVGRVDVFCSIHSAMHCIILVLPSPFFAKVNARGRYTLSGVPAGTYRVTAWHDRLPPRSLQVTVPAEGTVEQDFTLGLFDLPKEGP